MNIPEQIEALQASVNALQNSVDLIAQSFNTISPAMGALNKKLVDIAIAIAEIHSVAAPDLSSITDVIEEVRKQITPITGEKKDETV